MATKKKVTRKSVAKACTCLAKKATKTAKKAGRISMTCGTWGRGKKKFVGCITR